MRNCVDSTTDPLWIEEYTAAIHRFLATAPREGRKVSQAWWDLAVVTSQSCVTRITGEESDKHKAGDAFRHKIEMAKNGFLAEESMLPMLREHDAKSPPSDAKRDP